MCPSGAVTAVLAEFVQSQVALPPGCTPAADLIATTDPASITEHGQFYREEADCQVCGGWLSRGQLKGSKGSSAKDSSGRTAQKAADVFQAGGGRACICPFLSRLSHGGLAKAFSSAFKSPAPFLASLPPTHNPRRCTRAGGWRCWATPRTS